MKEPARGVVGTDCIGERGEQMQRSWGANALPVWLGPAQLHRESKGNEENVEQNNKTINCWSGTWCGSFTFIPHSNFNAVIRVFPLFMWERWGLKDNLLQCTANTRKARICTPTFHLHSDTYPVTVSNSDHIQIIQTVSLIGSLWEADQRC